MSNEPTALAAEKRSDEELAVSSYKHSLKLADKPKPVSKEENQDLIALQTRLKDRLKELGILD